MYAPWALELIFMCYLLKDWLVTIQRHDISISLIKYQTGFASYAFSLVITYINLINNIFIN